MKFLRRFGLVITFITVGGAVFLTGCGDSVLDVEPTNNISESAVWDDEGLVDAYLNDVYARMEFQGTGYLPSAMQTTEDAMGGAVRPMRDATWTPPYWLPRVEITQSGVPGGPGFLQFNPLQFWNWDELREANLIIKNLQPDESELPRSIRREKIAEARWLRAFMYFKKVIRYGGVPIIREPQNPLEADSSELFVERNTEQEVYDFILEELNTVINGENGQGTALPTSRYGGGRATVWAAHALKSRAMLHAAGVAQFGGGDVDLSGQTNLLGIPESEADRYWDAAYEASMAVIDGPHSLYQENSDPAMNFRNLFLTDCVDNPEAIFCREYDGDNVGHAWTRQTVPRQARPGVWAANAAVTWKHVERFGFHSGPYADQVGGEIDRSLLRNDQFTVQELFGNRDARFRGSVLYPEAEWDGETIYLHEATRVDGEIQSESGAAGSQTIEGVADSIEWLKSSLRHDRDATGLISVKRTSRDEDDIPRGEDDTDWMEFRLGEMYLNAAEAAFEMSGSPSGPSAQSLIDDLRDRANMPSMSVSRELIRNERRVELSLEKQLYWDLRRWRVAHEELDGARPEGVTWLYDWNDKKYEITGFENSWPEAFTFPKRQYYHPIGTQRRADTGLQKNPGY